MFATDARVTGGRSRLPRVCWEYLCLAVSASLLWCFADLGVAVSTFVRHQGKALVHVLLLWVGSVALLDFALAGLMLKWRLNAQAVFALAALNPVQDARLALLSAAEPELSILGPVGFYLVQHVGAVALQALGLLWPLVLGTAAWAAGLLAFRRQDLT
jgi:ABC-2 type transport system permease protein